jgi:hypothetical protein
MLPYMGKGLDEEMLNQVAGEEAHRWVSANMFGGKLPSKEELDAFAQETGAATSQRMAADPRYAADAGATGGLPTLQPQRDALAWLEKYAPPPPVAKVAAAGRSTRPLPTRPRPLLCSRHPSTPEERRATR